MCTLALTRPARPPPCAAAAQWVGAAIGLTNSLINAVEVQRDGAAAAAAQKTLTGNRKKQKGKQRR